MPHLSVARKGAHDGSLIRPLSDDDMAMLLCEQFDFDDGAILLLERGGRHLDVARKLMEQSDHERLLDGFLRADECDYIRTHSAPHMANSGVSLMDKDKGKAKDKSKGTRTDTRKSTSTRT